VAELLLHGRTVFDLLGAKENDLTYSLGWGVANSDRLARQLLADVAAELGIAEDPGSIVAVRLQEHVKGSGFTDVEIESDAMHVILEAKRGWTLPEEAQLAKYAPQLHPGRAGALLAVGEGSPAFATGRLPESVPGTQGEVPVVYRSWEQLMTQTVTVRNASRSHAEKRLLDELVRYLGGLMTVQDIYDNSVYVVSLGGGHVDWLPSDMTPRDVVVKHDRYFHPVGGGRGGWPKEPPNYLGFRFDGRLQQIRHVDSYTVFTHLQELMPGVGDEFDFVDPHYGYHLGPIIRPDHPVPNGPKIVRSMRCWAALDLLLTCETITEARDRTQQRENAAMQGVGA
jgi:hypothetical protein